MSAEPLPDDIDLENAHRKGRGLPPLQPSKAEVEIEKLMYLGLTRAEAEMRYVRTLNGDPIPDAEADAQLEAQAQQASDADARPEAQTESEKKDFSASIRDALLADFNTGPQAIDAATAPRMITARLPICGAVLAGTGGLGKTVLTLWEMVRIANGMDLYGDLPERSGNCMMVSAEDSVNHVRWILQEVLRSGVAHGDLSSEQAQRAKELVRIGHWQRSRFGPIAGASLTDGSFFRSQAFDALLAALARFEPVMAALDPAVLFTPGERYGNDGDAFIAAMIHEAALDLGILFEQLDHVSQYVARNAIVDQHAPRGGTAKSDNARLVRQLTRVRPEDVENEALPGGISSDDVAQGRVLRLYWTKSNYTPPIAPVWLRRVGYWIEHLHQPSQQDHRLSLEAAQSEQQEADIATVVAFVQAQLAVGDGIRYSQSALEDEHPVSRDGRRLPRARVRTACQQAVATGRLIRLPLPKSEWRGQRKDYLAPPGGKLL